MSYDECGYRWSRFMDSMINTEFLIRDAKAQDLDDICQLGLLLNTVNLPGNEEELSRVIGHSEKSFSEQIEEPSQRTFLFVLVNNKNRVIGTSQIFAKHGTWHFPHMYFQVSADERYSLTLDKYFCHQTMRLIHNYDGPTEIGSLVLSLDYRLHPAKLGRFLSFTRFLFIAMNRSFFTSTILAELLPPLGPNFESALWDAIGRKFTGLEYYEADMISRQNKEFIKSLFPTTDIYTSLLPLAAQQVIGQVGSHSRAAAHLLKSIGFRYSHRVDPFDGGPHFEALQENITLIKEACFGYANIKNKTVSNIGLIGHYDPKAESGERFKAIVAPYSYSTKGEINIDEPYYKALDIKPDAMLTAIPLKSKS